MYYFCKRLEDKGGFLYLNGEMAEWSIAAVLKTVELRGSGGSNPSLSAGRFQKVFTRVFNLAFKKQIIVVKSRFYNDFSLYIALLSDGINPLLTIIFRSYSATHSATEKL